MPSGGVILDSNELTDGTNAPEPKPNRNRKIPSWSGVLTKAIGT